MNGERMILIPSSAFGTLRKDLIENIGMDRMKGFLIRYGWNLGVSDASKVLKKDFSSVFDLLKQGPILHMMKGHTSVNTSRLEVDLETDQSVKSVHVEGIWMGSYEAEEHVRQFGISESPVCHTLIGYASGYYSTICNHTVIFKELTCIGKGDNECRYVGKSMDCWKGEVDDEFHYYQKATIVKELEITYDKLLEERNNLSKTSSIDKRLTEEIINGNDLQSISDIVHEITGIPLVIEDANFRAFAYSGLTAELFEMADMEFRTYLCNKKLISKQGAKHYEPFSRTSKITMERHHRLITPIRLRKKIIGYCSFIHLEPMESYPEIELMILERIATVCSLYLLNEKTSFEAFERMKGHFLEQILSGQLTSKKEILKRGSYVHLNLDQPFHIMVMKDRHPRAGLENELSFHEQVMETTLQYFKNQKRNVLVGQRSGNMVVLVPEESLINGDITEFCDIFIDHLAASYPNSIFQIGISTKTPQIENAPECYEEAVVALRMASSGKKIVLYESLGIVGPLINPRNESAIKKMAHHFLGPLYGRDDSKKTELIKTLYVFLSNGGNLEKTRKDLSLSISGLRYRIQKIETLLGREIRDPVAGYQLFLTIQALIATGEIMI